MAKVRGSQQHRMVLKPHRPRRLWLMCLLVLLCGAVVWGVGFFFGTSFEKQSQVLQPNGQQLLVQLRNQLVEIEQERLVDQMAVEGARSDLKEKQEQIQQLEKDLSFYQGVLAPEKNVKGLQVARLGVEKLSDAGVFRLNWVLTQAGDNSHYLGGQTTLKIIGRLAGAEKVLSLSDVDAGESNLVFKFRYFQSFSVRIKLPNLFVVEEVLLNAVTKGGAGHSISKRYKWAVQEALVDVE